MPYEIKWYIPEHIIHSRIYGDVDIETLKKHFEIVHEMHESVDTPLVHMIADLRDVQSFPKNLSDYKEVFGYKAENSAWVILIGDNKLIRFFSAVATNVLNLRLKYVSDLDEAMEHLIARDPALTTDKVKAAKQ